MFRGAQDAGGRVEGVGSSAFKVASQGATPNRHLPQSGVNQEPKRAFDCPENFSDPFPAGCGLYAVFQAVGIRYPELSLPPVRVA